MNQRNAPSPLRVLLPVGLGTALALMGDASLYTVLPTHTADAGVSLASVGIILSVNRFIRLALNGPVGVLYDRWHRRGLFVLALFIGAGSTAIYGLTQGFWPLLMGRLLWGLAWAGIWVGGNTIILDVSRADNRGRWVGVYQTTFFLGAAGGALLGGLLTDALGYHQAMITGASVTCLGAIIALIFLPETRGLQSEEVMPEVDPPRPSLFSNPTERAEFASASALYAANRLALAGILQATLGLFLLKLMGDQVQIVGHVVGVATLTGMGLSLSTLVSMTSAPLMGGLSDRVGNRWRAVAGGLVPGVAGFGLLAVGLPLTVLVGIPLAAITGGSNQSLATALIGDLGDGEYQSRRLGVLFTIGDLASAVGPLLAYALIPWWGIKSVYLLGAGIFALMFVVSLRWAARPVYRSVPAGKGV